MEADSYRVQEEHRARHLALVAALGLIVPVVALAGTLGGPAYFLQLGEKTPSLPAAKEILGEGIPVPLRDGHDGDRFWMLARDPFLTDPGFLNANLDRPVYRAQRIAYPLLSSPWHLGGEEALLWGMVITNIVILGFGAYITGKWAAEMGGRGRLVFAFLFNPLVWGSLLFDLADALALLGLIGALRAFTRGRSGSCVAFGVVGTLAKESTLLGLGAVALLAQRRSIADRALLVLPGAIAASLWRLYVISRLGFDSGQGLQEFTPVPFEGYVTTWRLGWGPQGDLLHSGIAAAWMAVGLLTLVLWMRDRSSVLLSAALPYVLILPFLTPQVVSIWFNVTRASGPVLTLVALHLLAERRGLPDQTRRPRVVHESRRSERGRFDSTGQPL